MVIITGIILSVNYFINNSDSDKIKMPKHFNAETEYRLSDEEEKIFNTYIRALVNAYNNTNNHKEAKSDIYAHPDIFNPEKNFQNIDLDFLNISQNNSYLSTAFVLSGSVKATGSSGCIYADKASTPTETKEYIKGLILQIIETYYEN